MTTRILPEAPAAGVATAGCFSCGSRSTESVIDLRPTPPANALAATDQQARDAAPFPLHLVRCLSCGLLQLADRVDRDLLFRDYRYATGAAPGLVRHFSEHARRLIERHDLTPESRIVEIGSNDGTLLGHFAGRGMAVTGVDPAVDLAAQATANGVPTLGEHFDLGVADRIRADSGPADLVLANNVLAHVDDLNSVLDGVRLLLGPGGHAVFEVAHALPMLEQGVFEFVYHEHTAYFSLHTLAGAVARHGMVVVDVEEIATQGGSLRVWVRPDSPGEGRPRVDELLARERSVGLVDGELAGRFAGRVGRVTTIVSDVVMGLHQRGRRICGYGASARAVTLMAQSGIGDAIERIVDDNPRKIGMFVPGSATPVVGREGLTAEEIDYCVLFAWNFQQDIVAATTGFVEAGGRFVVPFPHVTIG